MTLNYDSQMRLTSLLDATGRSTTFPYQQSGWPLLITAITDPFGRSAKLQYDTTGRLVAITDVLGLTSKMSYNANSAWFIFGEHFYSVLTEDFMS